MPEIRMLVLIAVALAVVITEFYVINVRDGEINTLQREKFRLSEDLSIFIAGCNSMKDGCASVRSIKATNILENNGIEETYLGFNEVSNGDVHLESLYLAGDSKSRLTIEQLCKEIYYKPSIEGREELSRDSKLVAKSSYVYEVITDRDADITSPFWRQKAFIVFNEAYDVVCAWKVDITNNMPQGTYTPLKSS